MYREAHRGLSHDAVAAGAGPLPPHRLLGIFLQDRLDLLLGTPHHVLGGACTQVKAVWLHTGGVKAGANVWVGG